MDITLKLIREMKGLKQAAAAERLGISQSAYSKIERGITRTSREKLKEFFSLLGYEQPREGVIFPGNEDVPDAREAFYRELLRNYRMQMKYLREENETLRQQLYLLFRTAV